MTGILAEFIKNSDLNSGRNDYLTKQQTPNPLAQFPWFTPPLSPHSVEVKQVPKVLPPSIVVVHSTLSNWTTENNEKDSKERKLTEKTINSNHISKTKSANIWSPL